MIAVPDVRLYEVSYNVSSWDVEHSKVLAKEQAAVQCALGRKKVAKKHQWVVITRKVTIQADWTRQVDLTFQVLPLRGAKFKDVVSDALRPD